MQSLTPVLARRALRNGFARLAICLLLAGATACSEPKTPKPEGLAAMAAMFSLQKRLHDPGSFELVGEVVKPATLEDGSPGLAVYMIYRAKNGFGGVRTKRAIVTTSADGTEVKKIEDVPT